MFGHASLPSRIYSYDCKSPTNSEQIGEQIFKTHRYRNKLVEIELTRRKTIADAQLACYPALAAIEAKIAAAEQQLEQHRSVIKELNKAARSKSQDPAIALARASIKAMAVALKQLRAERAAEKAQSWSATNFTAAQDKANADAGIAQRKARADAVLGGLYWGNYLAAEKSVSRSGRPPRFHGWRFDGKVSLQIQGGMSPTGVFACADNRLRIEVLPTPPGRSSHKQFARVYFRIGSNDKGGPVWSTVETIMHRPLPGDCRIKEAYLTRRRIGPHVHWKVQFVVAREAWEPKATGDRLAGIDIGWRKLEDGMRVAYWVGDDERTGELILPNDLLARWQKCRELAEIRDLNFNFVKQQLRAWLMAAPSDFVPSFLAAVIKLLPVWKKKGHLVNVLKNWSLARFADDEKGFAILKEWAAQDKHLYEWEESNRTKATAIREHSYRNFVTDLRKNYGTACLEAMSLKELKARPEPESEETKTAGKEADIAALSRLRAILAESLNIVKVDPKNTTKECHRCHGLCVFDAAKELHHVCEWCGDEWDQDANAANNLLQRGTGIAITSTFA